MTYIKSEPVQTNILMIVIVCRWYSVGPYYSGGGGGGAGSPGVTESQFIRPDGDGYRVMVIILNIFWLK